jgi:hypothetical protein
MKKEEGKDVYILGDSNTIITPVEILDDYDLRDYRAVVFSNDDILYSKGETITIGAYDLVIGFKSEQSIDLLIQKLQALKEM